MIWVTQLRLGFQILAFCFFLHQMHQSIQKYIDSPISITKVNHKELIPAPVLFVCQPGQFNYNTSSRFGYKWMVNFWSGILTLDVGKKVTWKGKDGNQSYAALIEELYNFDYSVVKMTHGKLGRNLFSLNLGMCKEVIDVQYNKLPTLETNKKVFLIAVDPFTQTDLRINYDPNAVATIGNLENGLYNGEDVMIEYSITDETILDEVKCRNYQRINSSYGQCVMDHLQVSNLIKLSNHEKK